MRQVVTYEPRRLAIQSVPALQAGPGEVVVEVQAVGICGSDLHIFNGTHAYLCFPVVQGHEIAGRLRSVGAGVAHRRTGEMVTVEPTVPCGECFACRRGRDNACARLQVLGVHRPGGFADEVLVGADRVHAVGDLDPELAVLCEPVAVALQAVERAGVEAGDHVVVIGGGSIGRAISMVAADQGAEVLIADREPARLRLAERLGAQRAVNTTTEDLMAAIQDFTHGDGARIVLEATGVPAVIAATLDLVAPTGTVVIVGVSGEQVCLPVGIFTRKELTVLGSRNSTAKFPLAVDVVRRHRSVLQEFVSHRFPLEQAAEAIRLATDHAELVSKAILIPTGAGRP